MGDRTVPAARPQKPTGSVAEVSRMSALTGPSGLSSISPGSQMSKRPSAATGVEKVISGVEPGRSVARRKLPSTKAATRPSASVASA